MRIFLLLFFIQVISFTLFAQDTTQIVYTQETEKLAKQRFIDRYENVFMTKIPTRHMFKIGISQYYQSVAFRLMDERAFSNASLQLGYEFKFLPAFSISVNGYIPYYGIDVPAKTSIQNSVIGGQLRWYYDMRKRIRKGVSANNFSGNYIGLNYSLIRKPNEPDQTTIGFIVGFQRRFLNNGFMDFAFALRQEDSWFYYGLLNNWTFSTLSSFGIALGDWKKSNKVPLCDVLMCNSNISQQLKIKLPELTFGYYENKIRLGAAYEKKIKSSPITLNLQFDLALNKAYDYFDFKDHDSYTLALSREISASFSTQPRYYFLQKRDELRGKMTNGISGIYTGLNLEYNYYAGKHGFVRINVDKRITTNTVFTGALFGFQQRLFNHGYVDFNASYNYAREFNYSTNQLKLKTNIALGFAF